MVGNFNTDLKVYFRVLIVAKACNRFENKLDPIRLQLNFTISMCFRFLAKKN